MNDHVDPPAERFQTRLGAQQFGPYSADEVVALVQARRLTKHHQISNDGNTWLPLGRHPRFADCFVPVSAVPPLAETDFVAVKSEVAPPTLLRPLPHVTQTVSMPLSMGPGSDRQHAEGTTEIPPLTLRAGAFLLDAVVLITALAFLVLVVLLTLMTRTGDPPLRVLLGLPSVLVAIGVAEALFAWNYFALYESSGHGGSLGKQALGLRITNLAGENVSFGSATLRFWSLVLLSVLCTCGIGLLVAVGHPWRQAMHDRLSETRVVRK